MSSQNKSGGPAFPHARLHVDSCNDLFNQSHQYGGMTLRDYFAIRVAAALYGNLTHGEKQSTISAIPSASYKIADAMIAAREAQP